MSDYSSQPGGSPIPTGDLVAVDGTSIGGDGSVQHPLTALAGAGTVITDEVTIQGDGSHANPVEVKQIEHDSTLSGAGTLSSPLHVVVAGGSGVAVEDEGTPLVGNPYATLDFVGPGVAATDVGGIVARVTVPGTVTVDSTTVGGNGQGTPLHVLPAGLDDLVAVAVDGTTIGGNGLSGTPLHVIPGGLGARVTYTATGSEGSDFVVPIGVTLPSADYSITEGGGGQTNIILPDMPTADRTTTHFRVVTTSAPLAGDVFDFVLTL